MRSKKTLLGDKMQFRNKISDQKLTYFFAFEKSSSFVKSKVKKVTVFVTVRLDPSWGHKTSKRDAQ